MISLISNIIGFFTKYYKLIAVIIIIGLTAIFVKQCSDVKKYQKDIVRLQSNIEYYQQLSDSTVNNNKTLRLTVEELTNSKDSLINQSVKLAKQLKIKPKEIKTVYTNTVQLKDTVRDTIPQNSNFIKVFKLNSLTTITVEKKDSILTVIPDITNQQTLFVEEKKVYKYKGFLKRLIKLNFKKTTNYNYHIVNSNELVITTNSRVINVE